MQFEVSVDGVYDFRIHFRFVELQQNKSNQPVTEVNQTHNKMRPGPSCSKHR